MNRIDELIKKLCPNGVEYRPIWSLTAWDKKFNGVDKEKQKKVISYKYYLSTDFTKVEKKNGNIKYISTGISGDDRYTTEELAGDYIADGEVVCIPWGGTPNVKYHKGKFVTGDNRIATSLDVNILSNKFLYYWMQSKINVISKFYRGSGIKHPSMKDVLDMNIAVPPLEVQCEIVHILDDFTLLSALLSAELSAELKARKKQYEFYSKNLFDFNDEVDWVNLEFIAEIGTGSSNTNEAVENGKYPFYVRSQQVYYKNDYEYDDNSIITSGDGVGVGKIFHYTNGKYALHQRAYRIHIIDSKVNSKYFYYYMKSTFYDYIQKNAFNSSVTSIRRPMLNKYPIPVPSLEKQNKVVDILDRFDKLCNDISEALPAEIEARQKQYEYYRDKLLTFKELKVNE